MSNGNHVSIVGNLTRDPELRFTPSGQATASFGVAVNRRWQNRQSQEWEEATSFFDVVCWGQLAENAAQSLTKGARVLVSGRLDQRSWETQEHERRSKIEITADEVAPSLRWATASHHQERARAPRTVGGAPPSYSGRRTTRPQRADRRSTTTKRSRSKSWPATTTVTATAVQADRQGHPPAGQEEGLHLLQGHATWVDYKDVNLLRRFMSDRGKIRARRVTGNCAQHQRDVQVAIKTARELALLPLRPAHRQRARAGPGPAGRGDDGAASAPSVIAARRSRGHRRRSRHERRRATTRTRSPDARAARRWA